MAVWGLGGEFGVWVWRCMGLVGRRFGRGGLKGIGLGGW